MSKSGSGSGQKDKSAAQMIDERIKTLGDWRGKMLARLRALIQQADPDVIEQWKWSVPVWSHDGILCTGETYKNVVKMTFARGAALEDPSGLFNSSLTGNTRRAIDFHEAEKIDEAALKRLIREAVALNRGSRQSSKKAVKPKLLSGGNPQIAKGDGDAPVQAYIAAIPGWKRNVGRRLDALIQRIVPNVRKAVKWNSPFYGADDGEGNGGWFLSFHCFTNYIKVTFFRGRSLRPVPPGESKHKEVRYLDIHEDWGSKSDEAQLADWVKQASQLLGERM